MKKLYFKQLLLQIHFRLWPKSNPLNLDTIWDQDTVAIKHVILYSLPILNAALIFAIFISIQFSTHVNIFLTANYKKQ